MEAKKKTNAASYVAGLLFLAYMLWSLIGSAGYYARFHNPTESIAFFVGVLAELLLGIGLLAGSKGLTVVGAVGNVAERLLVFLWYLTGLEIPFRACFQSMLIPLVIVLLLLLAVCIRNRGSVALGIVSAVLDILNFVYNYIRSGYRHSLSSILMTLLFAAACLMTGLAVRGGAKKAAAPSGSEATLRLNDTSDRIEKLTRIKALLDCGAITQAEFEAKKKQILD